MNNRGFTIIEMTVASGIAATVTLALSSLLVWAVVEFEGVKRRLQAQGEALRAELLLRRYVSTGIKVRTEIGPNAAPWSNNTNFAIPNGATVNGAVIGTVTRTFGNAADAQGIIGPDFDYDQIADWPANGWRNVGFFLREWKEPPISGGANSRRTNLVETGIFLRGPTATTSGVMFLDVSGDNPGGAMRPDYSDQWVGGIVEFKVERKVKNGVRHFGSAGPPAAYTDNRVVSVLFDFKLRYHFASNLPKIWCPTADITAGVGGCTGGSGYADIQRSVRVIFGNNSIGTRDEYNDDEWIEERPMGYLHFFRPVLPNVWEN